MDGNGSSGTVSGKIDGEASLTVGTASDQAGGAWLDRALHDLCQPLMALECLLYVNREPVGGEPLEAAVLRTVIDEGFVECRRMMVLVKGIQERLTRSEEGMDRMK